MSSEPGFLQQNPWCSPSVSHRQARMGTKQAQVLRAWSQVGIKAFEERWIHDKHP